jgi:hypothetical protein
MEYETARLLEIITRTLGTTTPQLWTFLHGGDTSEVTAIGSAQVVYTSQDESGVVGLDDEFAPLQLPSGLHAYYFGVVGNNHIASSIDHADHSFGNGTVDSAFSLGAMIMAMSVSDNTIMAKYDATAAEEWKWQIAPTTGALRLELYDASANASEIADSDSNAGEPQNVVRIGEWMHVCTTYDGGETAPVIKHYLNGAQKGDGSSAETSTYTAMENLAAPLLIGASELTAAPAEEFHGYIALPFLTGKELTQAEVLKIYDTTKRLVLKPG